MSDTPTQTENEGPSGFHRRMHDEGQDIGGGVHIRYFVVGSDLPDREEHGGLIISHLHDDGEVCQGSVNFDTPRMREKFPNKPFWTVESEDPLTLSPSISQKGGPDGAECLHGFIRQGRWEGV